MSTLYVTSGIYPYNHQKMLRSKGLFFHPLEGSARSYTGVSHAANAGQIHGSEGI
jgi:hypothetical protein